ncbi:MAG: hypothetical protein LBH62_08615 [Nitrososphaerota archaeon]|jgi:hypothetical protein|nr:hypothetical protein [Nitrososphaerota archaeon]
MMKTRGLLLVFLIVGVAIMPALFIRTRNTEVKVDEFYFGVSFGGEFAEEALPLIDKVKDSTNFFVVASWGVATNETALNLVCDYAAASGLHFVVFFDFISRTVYPWHQQWLTEAPKRWGDKFLGVYLNDEHGGKQVDATQRFSNATDYNDAAQRFISAVQYGASGIATSMTDAKDKDVPLFTADYLLHWWVYLAGYDVVFAELGWNATANRQIALCRGAAMVQDKDWGTIITWESDLPPYLGSDEQIYHYMLDSYRAGAKYVVVFNYPTFPENNPYGILTEEQFNMMQQFWQYTKFYPRSTYGVVIADTALVLPQNYGWGMRTPNDNIWGIWPADDKATQILNNIQWMETRRGLQFDIVYEDPNYDYTQLYQNVVYWNTTMPTS